MQTKRESLDRGVRIVAPWAGLSRVLWMMVFFGIAFGLGGNSLGSSREELLLAGAAVLLGILSDRYAVNKAKNLVICPDCTTSLWRYVSFEPGARLPLDFNHCPTCGISLNDPL